VTSRLARTNLKMLITYSLTTPGGLGPTGFLPALRTESFLDPPSVSHAGTPQLAASASLRASNVPVVASASDLYYPALLHPKRFCTFNTARAVRKAVGATLQTRKPEAL
jgi:hypothetical protein